jgi:hypothetical protein
MKAPFAVQACPRRLLALFTIRHTRVPMHQSTRTIAEAIRSAPKTSTSPLA